MAEHPVPNAGLRAAVIGASGGLGRAFVNALADDPSLATVCALSRSTLVELPRKVSTHHLDLLDESTIVAAARECAQGGPLDLVIVASGMLHDGPDVWPEKTWTQIGPAGMARSFAINCTGPALVAKHFMPLLNGERRSVFAALSARVGSIGDNRLGGWYAYRASKAALNMIIRCLAIELARTRPESICIGLHPGTVETALSEPFRSRVPPQKLFSPELAARQLLAVMNAAVPSQSGRVLAWDGTEVEP